MFPIVAGGGKKLFDDGLALGLELIEAKASSTGVAIHTYRRTELPQLP